LTKNLAEDVVEGFGDEWTRFDQQPLSEAELEQMFQAYFRIFPWESLGPDSVGFDAGCGSGRWARLVAPRVGRLICIDASAEAIKVAKRNLESQSHCEFHVASVDSMPVSEASMDFGYSLGVLHHVPDTAQALGTCVSKLKPGAPFLLYLYYAFDNRPLWFRLLWRVSEPARYLLSRAPNGVRYAGSQVIAALIYWPLARTAQALERLGLHADAFPLSYYRDRSFYVMRNDALDRFGTRLEQRFSRDEIGDLMRAAGLDDVEFSEFPPYWCAVGRKK
jgi:SAM-dependent methyltransferase